MATYTVKMDTTDQATFLANRQGNNFRLEANDTVVTFDEAAHWWFTSRLDSEDGHIDSDNNLWFGGDPYPVRAEP